MQASSGCFVAAPTGHAPLSNFVRSRSSDGTSPAATEVFSSFLSSGSGTADSDESERFRRSCHAFLRSSKSFNSISRPSVTLIRRKSAVERLEESKNQYVKSEHVRESRQQLVSSADKTRTSPLSVAVAAATINSTCPSLSTTATIASTHHSLPTTSSSASSAVLSEAIDDKQPAIPVPGTLSRRRTFSSGRPPDSVGSVSVNNLEARLRQLISSSQESLERGNDEHQTPVRRPSRSPAANSRQTLIAKPKLSLPRSFSYVAPRVSTEPASHTQICKALDSANSTLSESKFNNSACMRLATGRPASISRSKSDIGHRVVKEVKTRDEQERFFATIGLDSSTWAALTESNSKSLASTPTRFFASTESVDSAAKRVSVSSRAGSTDDTIQAIKRSTPTLVSSLASAPRPDSPKRQLILSSSLSSHGLSRETSIVEKNARVIKWLYSLRD